MPRPYGWRVFLFARLFVVEMAIVVGTRHVASGLIGWICGVGEHFGGGVDCYCEDKD